MKKIYLKKLRRAFAFNIKGRCACGGKAEIMFYDEKFCLVCWVKMMHSSLKGANYGRKLSRYGKVRSTG